MILFNDRGDHDDHASAHDDHRTAHDTVRDTMAGQYWFPSMSHEEIIDSFSEWGITIGMNDLKRPSSDFVTNIYAACLQQVTTLTADSLQGPVQTELAKLDSSVRPIPCLVSVLANPR